MLPGCLVTVGGDAAVPWDTTCYSTSHCATTTGRDKDKIVIEFKIKIKISIEITAPFDLGYIYISGSSKSLSWPHLDLLILRSYLDILDLGCRYNLASSKSLFAYVWFR